MPNLLTSRHLISRVAIFTVTLVVSTGTALAAGDFGAIAFSPSTHGHGYVFGFSTPESANQGAIDECKKYSRSGDCMSVVTSAEGCAALAVGTDSYGSAIGENSNAAQDTALRNCQSAGSGRNCRVTRWLCH